MKAWGVAVGLGALMLAPSAMARVCAVSIDSTDQMSFSSREIKVAADCTAVDLTLRHTGKLAVTAMGHNWVLTRTADYQPVAMAGMRMTLADSSKKDFSPLFHTIFVFLSTSIISSLLRPERCAAAIKLSLR